MAEVGTKLIASDTKLRQSRAGSKFQVGAHGWWR